MAGYALSDVRTVLREREWDNWDELLVWLDAQDGDAQAGMSERDRRELLADLRRLRDDGAPLTRDPGELYQRLGTVRTIGVTADRPSRAD